MRYCNYTQGSTSGLPGSCISIDKRNIASGTTITYRDASNLTQSVLGCGNPGGQPSCVVYSCVNTTGNCKIDYSGCQCTTNSQCNDNGKKKKSSKKFKPNYFIQTSTIKPKQNHSNINLKQNDQLLIHHQSLKNSDKLFFFFECRWMYH